MIEKQAEIRRGYRGMTELIFAKHYWPLEDAFRVFDLEAAEIRVHTTAKKVIYHLSKQPVLLPNSPAAPP